MTVCVFPLRMARVYVALQFRYDLFEWKNRDSVIVFVFFLDKDVPDSNKQKEESPLLIKETIIGDKDVINALGEKKHEKSEIIKRRPRAILAATPMLEEIPEEKSHGSGSDTNNARIATDDSKNKGKKGKKHASILQVCF